MLIFDIGASNGTFSKKYSKNINISSTHQYVKNVQMHVYLIKKNFLIV